MTDLGAKIVERGSKLVGSRRGRSFGLGAFAIPAAASPPPPSLDLSSPRARRAARPVLDVLLGGQELS
jgi:hypothetical protein